MEFNLREKAEIVSLAQEANTSLDSKPLTEWYAEKMQKPLVENIYANAREEIHYLKEKTGSTIAEAKEYLDHTRTVGTPIVGDDLNDIELNCNLLSTQLQLLDRSNIVDSLRDMDFEAEAREWAFITEED